jgi:hypothetical protein
VCGHLLDEVSLLHETSDGSGLPLDTLHLSSVLLLPAVLLLQVLPRYQRLASQLYERLRVVTLDDVLPALDAALTAAAR